MKYPKSRTQERYIRSVARTTAESLKKPELGFVQIIGLVSTIIKNLKQKFDDCEENIEAFKLLVNEGDESEIGDIAGYKINARASAERALYSHYDCEPSDEIKSLLKNQDFLELQKTIFDKCFAEICQANEKREKRQNETSDSSASVSEASHSDDTPGGSPRSSDSEEKGGGRKKVRFAENKLNAKNDIQQGDGASAAGRG